MKDMVTNQQRLPCRIRVSILVTFAHLAALVQAHSKGSPKHACLESAFDLFVFLLMNPWETSFQQMVKACGCDDEEYNSKPWAKDFYLKLQAIR